MDMIPVFTRFDLFLNYDGHKIEDYTQYYIYCEEKTLNMLFCLIKNIADIMVIC